MYYLPFFINLKLMYIVSYSIFRLYQIYVLFSITDWKIERSTVDKLLSNRDEYLSSKNYSFICIIENLSTLRKLITNNDCLHVTITMYTFSCLGCICN